MTTKKATRAKAPKCRSSNITPSGAFYGEPRTGNLFPTPRGYASIPYRLLDLRQLEVSALDTDNALALECVSRLREVLGDVAEGLNDWLAVDDKVTVDALESNPWSTLRDLTQAHDEDVLDKGMDELRDELYGEVESDINLSLEVLGDDEESDTDVANDIRARCRSILETVKGKGKA